MSNLNPRAEIKDQLDRYKSLRDAGELFGAVLRLAYAEYHAAEISAVDRASLENQISSFGFSDSEREQVLARTDNEAKRLLRLFYATDSLVEDEIFAIITYRHDLEVMVRFLRKYWALAPSFSMSRVDEEIEGLRNTKKFSAMFTRVVRAIHKNSGVILRNTCVDEVT